MAAKPLNSEQKADAQRLRAAWKVAKDNDRSLTQAKIAELGGWETQGTVSHYMNGVIPLNWKALVAICRAIGANPKDISPRLYRENAVSARGGNAEIIPLRMRATTYEEVDELDDKEFATGRFYTSTKAAAGSGSEADNDQDFFELPFRRYSLHKEGIGTDNIIIVRVRNDSMEPAFMEGDTIAIDGTDIDPRPGCVFLIEDEDQARLKYVETTRSGLRISSENGDNYPAEELSVTEVMRRRIRIVGRVFWQARWWRR